MRRLLAALTIPSGTYKICRDGERVGVRVKDEIKTKQHQGMTGRVPTASR